jgi:hypothetical protein
VDVSKLTHTNLIISSGFLIAGCELQSVSASGNLCFPFILTTRGGPTDALCMVFMLR